MDNLNNIEKACAFYVSDAHLSAMIMPYVSKQIKNNNIVETFFEKDIEKNIEIILSKIILDEKNKKEIKKINWKNSTNKNIEKIINNLLENNENIIINILINGQNEYIEHINQKINNIIKNTCLNNNIKIRIINCYSVDQAQATIRKIINENDYLLNTAGIKKINEIYEKKSLIG